MAGEREDVCVCCCAGSHAVPATAFCRAVTSAAQVLFKNPGSRHPAAHAGNPPPEATERDPEPCQGSLHGSVARWHRSA